MQILNTDLNIFELPTSNEHAVCITTNGVIKKNGSAVMGVGIAKEADSRYHLGIELADHLRDSGNTPYIFSVSGKCGCKLISFPTKDNWRDKSSITLIKRSAELIINLCERNNVSKCFLVPPGCGHGGLDWLTEVEPILKGILDDRFIVVIRNS